MGNTLFAGALFATAYYALSEPPRRKVGVKEDKRPFEEGVIMTTNVRKRIHESIGTGAEIGAEIGIFPNDPSDLQYHVPKGKLPTGPQLKIGNPALHAPFEAPTEPDIHVPEPISSLPVIEHGTDPDMLHPGQITVIPARLRPPVETEPLTKLDGPLMPVHESKGPASTSWVEQVDWNQLRVDFAAAMERMKSVSSEPGDAAKAGALLKQANQQTHIEPRAPPNVPVDHPIDSSQGRKLPKRAPPAQTKYIISFDEHLAPSTVQNHEAHMRAHGLRIRQRLSGLRGFSASVTSARAKDLHAWVLRQDGVHMEPDHSVNAGPVQIMSDTEQHQEARHKTPDSFHPGDRIH